MPAPSKKRDKFYHSTAWKKCRQAKVQQARGICERCGKAGWEVHHIKPLTDENIDDPNISLSLENLMLLCTVCHNKMRDDEAKARGYTGVREDVSFDEHGNIVIRDKRED